LEELRRSREFGAEALEVPLVEQSDLAAVLRGRRSSEQAGNDGHAGDPRSQHSNPPPQGPRNGFEPGCCDQFGQLGRNRNHYRVDEVVHRRPPSL